MDYVLVIDDEVAILKFVSENLEIRGYQVLQATNGTQALDHLHAGRPALMVLDIKLPDFTGWELLRRIQDDPLIKKDFPVLMMTASITETNIDISQFPSVVNILIKPFSSSRLVSAVQSTLGQK